MFDAAQTPSLITPQLAAALIDAVWSGVWELGEPQRRDAT